MTAIGSRHIESLFLTINMCLQNHEDKIYNQDYPSFRSNKSPRDAECKIPIKASEIEHTNAYLVLFTVALVYFRIFAQISSKLNI